VALIGESGSGKTTIALTLMGYAREGCRISGGSVVVDGQDMVTLPERERASIRGTKVSYVPQSAAAAFNPAHRIIDQVIEITRIHKLMSEAEARARAIELFRAMSLPEPETIGERYPHQVSGGQLQRLAAVMALIGDPSVVIFDEPTTALDVTTQIEVLRAFKSAMRKGDIAGVYVSHDLAVVAQIADRIIVLKGGEIQESGTTREILEAPQHAYTKELLGAFRAHARASTPQGQGDAAPLIEIDHLGSGYGPKDAAGRPAIIAVEDVQLRLLPGRNLGIIGESGCGKSTLARTIAGILLAFSGGIRFEGRALAPDIRQRSKDDLRRLQIVFQYADTALNPASTIEDILARPLTFYYGMKGQKRDDRINALLDMVRLPRALRHRQPAELSGGQKQRVNFARALAANPSLIICDEITSALDTVVAAAVIDLLRELQRELQVSYLFISHDLSVVETICDEVAVMFGGRVVEHLTTDSIAHPSHPYSKLLFSSVPQLDPHWLDNLKQDAAEVRAFSRR